MFPEGCLVTEKITVSFAIAYGTKYSRMDQVKFVEDSL